MINFKFTDNKATNECYSERSLDTWFDWCLKHKAFYKENFSIRFYYLFFFISFLVLIYSCKDSYGIDPNIKKTPLYTDTISKSGNPASFEAIDTVRMGSLSYTIYETPPQSDSYKYYWNKNKTFDTSSALIDITQKPYKINFQTVFWNKGDYDSTHVKTFIIKIDSMIAGKSDTLNSKQTGHSYSSITIHSVLNNINITQSESNSLLVIKFGENILSNNGKRYITATITANYQNNNYLFRDLGTFHADLYLFFK